MTLNSNTMKDNLNKGLYLVYVRSNNFVARGIQFFMRLYALRFKREWRKPVNHTDIMYNGIVWGSTAQGYLPREPEIAWDHATDLFVYKLDTDKTKKEINNIFDKYKYRRYDYKSFIDFIVKAFTGKWTGHTGSHAESKLYCIEGSHMVMNELGIEPKIEEPWVIDPEQSRDWAIKNLEFIGKYKTNELVHSKG